MFADDAGNPRRRIPRLLRQAFKSAKEGDETSARRHWDDAVECGYEFDPETLRRFNRDISTGRIGSKVACGPPLRRTGSTKPISAPEPGITNRITKNPETK